MKQVKCGCEFNADTLVSLCDSHAAYFAAKFIKSKAPEVAPLDARQEKLRDALLVAIAPTRVARIFQGVSLDSVADTIVKYATAVAART